MKKTDSSFDDFLVATVLADLFDHTDSNDTELLAKKIVNGLEKNKLLTFSDLSEPEQDEFAAA